MNGMTSNLELSSRYLKFKDRLMGCDFEVGICMTNLGMETSTL